MHNERFALILVDHLDPARIAEDELETDRMVVDIVGDGAAVRNHDVRRNEPPTETAGDQVAVLHARPADTGISIGSPGDHELRDEIRDDERSWFDRDDGSLRCGGVEPDQPVGAVEIGDPGASAGEMVTSRYPSASNRSIAAPRSSTGITARSTPTATSPGASGCWPTRRAGRPCDGTSSAPTTDRRRDRGRSSRVARTARRRPGDIGDGRLGLRRFIVFASGLSDAKGSSPSAPGCGSVKRRS